MPRVFPTFPERRHVTALPGWRAASRRRPGLRDCSLVVPTAGRRDEVERLLDSLLALSDAPGEVVVVDSAPAQKLGDSLQRWAARAAAPFVLVYVASPPGLVRQRNIGVDLCTRDFVFFLDPDCVPLEGYFSATRRIFDLDTAACIGGVAGVIVNEKPRGKGSEPLTYRMSGWWSPRSYRKPFAGLRRVDVLPGCACAWRREVFGAQRFSCFFREYPEGEDVEFSLRAGDTWTLLYTGDARVRRFPSAAPHESGYAAGRAHIRNRYFIWRRHVPRPAPRHTARFWLNAAADAARAFGWCCLRPWRPAAAAYAAGIVGGMAACLRQPSFFVEPPARREYVLVPETPHLTAQTGN